MPPAATLESAAILPLRTYPAVHFCVRRVTSCVLRIRTGGAVLVPVGRRDAFFEPRDLDGVPFISVVPSFFYSATGL